MSKNVKLGLIIGGLAVAILVILPLVVGLTTGWEFCEYEKGGYGMMGFGMMGGWFTPIIWIALLGLVIWGVITLTKSVSSTGNQGSEKQQSALEILKARYAHGEIGKEEFEEKRKDLG